VSVVGNTTYVDGNGRGAPVKIDIIQGQTVLSTRNVTSSTEGKFSTQITGLSAGTYTANITSTIGSYTGNCQSDFTISTGINCSTPLKTLTLSGYAFDSTTGSSISSGNVTITVKETEDSASTSFTGGYWSLSFKACIISDNRYTLGIKITDSTGKTSYTQSSFISS